MTKKEHEHDADAHAQAEASALTVEAVQRLIDASFVRFEMTHGHMSAEDGARALAALKPT